MPRVPVARYIVEVRRTLWSAVSLTIALLLISGAAYPAVIYVVGQMIAPWAASGSLIRSSDGRVVGSALIGQGFTSDRYFHTRPSAVAYDAAGSGASNLGPTSPQLADSIARRAQRFRAANGVATDAPLPSDAVTSSGSGLDPDISPADAALQVRRVAAARGLNVDLVANLTARHVTPRTLGILGEPRINVLQLNLALDSTPGTR
jgi:potassium-transporting ATPase KdpC subunit